VLLIIPVILGPCGLLMFGFGAERSLHWAVLYVGYGLISIVPAAASIAMTYVMDSYFEVAAEGLLVVNGIKNVVAYGFTYGFIPWTTKVGYETVSIALRCGAHAGLLIQVAGLWNNGRNLDFHALASGSVVRLGRKYQEMDVFEPESDFAVKEAGIVAENKRMWSEIFALSMLFKS
jgi:hypothetical protein